MYSFCRGYSLEKKELLKEVRRVLHTEKTTITSPSKVKEDNDAISSLDDNDLFM